ncbi:hypothetical protein FIBSPDRAFT_1050572 [Athelia psychrophila]|uniref:Uncharacterized protein n=1 Tax=Athelia psychrophila TaxID=1759441 RepID=A0A166AIK9_9AGAM|nr:hypothetical protein FIBSPDRAFT_1050572 [Fibularhizoctonia sp. CBS 109695]
MTRAAVATVLKSAVRLPRIIANPQYRLPRQIILVDNNDKCHRPAQVPLRRDYLAEAAILHPAVCESRSGQWTIHDPRSWDWTAAEIQSYLEYHCLHSPFNAGVQNRQAMLQLYTNIIAPCRENSSPFVSVASQPGTLEYLTVSNGHGSQIPITDFYTAMGWIISIVEPHPPTRAGYQQLLATYARWCHTAWRALFPRTCVPTTASIKVVSLPALSASTSPHGPGPGAAFWLSTSLPHAALKEAARAVREQHMHALFGPLPAAPIWAHAVRHGGAWGRVKWGHCAETLTTMCAYFRVPPPALVCGVAIKLKPVARAPAYSAAVFSAAALGACDNCKTMMQHARIAYRDWYAHES